MAAKTRSCPRFPTQNLDGKEGVDGSSPSEGSAKARKTGLFLSANLVADDVLWLSGHTWATIAIAAGAIAAVAAATFAAWQVLISILNERKRTQPVVIAHDAGGRQFGDRGNPNAILPTYLTNEGGGNAFNVRSEVVP